jgi:phosphoenolpyruvate synthase/pyruvate phosphate dikinase
VKNNIVFLEEIGAGDTAIAGGKAANLGELVAKGFPVPPAFVVSAQVSSEVFNSLGLEDEIHGLDGSSRNAASRRIQRKIIDFDIPGPLADAIIEAHSRLIGDRGAQLACAVRSSATAEDLAGASFAGQHGTYYYVDRQRLLETIRRCWASMWSPEAVDYRSARGIPHGSVLMAVVVQEMVRSEISGVAFTANPLNG